MRPIRDLMVIACCIVFAGAASCAGCDTSSPPPRTAPRPTPMQQWREEMAR